jgi:hypothetical protein
MMRLSVEITPSNPKVSTAAISHLLFDLSKELLEPGFNVLQGPPQTRTVLLSMHVVDQTTNSILIGELVTAPHQPGGE